jgi:hypothetical protein
MIDRPYFMTNKEWYAYDFKKRKYYCTDKAPEKAKESLIEFYKTLNKEAP